MDNAADCAGKPGLPFYKTVLCLMCVLILIVNGFSLAHNLQSLKSTNELQTQSARVSAKVQYLNLLVSDAEGSLRGYFLSGSESYLGPVRTARAEIDTQFTQLQALLADNSSQLKNLAQLRMLVARKLAAMDQTLALYRSGGLGDVVRAAESADSASTMDEIRLMVVIIVQEQHELLAARGAAFYRQYQQAVLLGIGINLVAILVIALFYRLIRRSFFSRVVAQRALQNANDTLETMVVTRTEQLSVLSRHLIRVSEDEKARLARELHDEMGANLTAISMHLQAVGARLQPGQEALGAMLGRARAALVDTVELKRRIVENLRPSLLDNLGLSAALHSYCEEFSTITGVACEALVDAEVDAAGPMQAIAVFRIVQEALNNTAKYAAARHVVVRLARAGAVLELEVCDDGVGIAADAARQPKSHGLLGMRERALLLGGSLKVGRGVNGVGTSVEAEIPLTDAHGAARGEARAALPAPLNGRRPPAGDHIPTLPPCSIRPHIPPGLDGQVP
ncbi:MAG: CHASE3 domain-containing protein [Pseudomonadota bacterium]|nr:CHASE3 domain-containing protein [Pseudomonadota bacterium]